MITALDYLKTTYRDNPEALSFLLPHTLSVRDMAVSIASRVGADISIVYNGATLHDIGIMLTNAPGIGCFGNAPYIQHGILGKEILNNSPYSNCGTICETHVGVAISREQIMTENLQLPHRSIIPTSIEEEIIAYSDCFFSKSSKDLTVPKNINSIIKQLERFGYNSIETFFSWHNKFSE